MEELTVEAKTDNLGKILDFIAKILESANCAVKLQLRIAVVVEEVFVNIAQYAYAPNTGSATIRAAVGSGGELVIEFEDRGKPYNPLEKEDPDIALSAEEREIGGLGIYMVKQMMDTVTYRRDGDKNILTMKKTIS